MIAPAAAFSSVISITCAVQGLTAITRPTIPPDVTTGMLRAIPEELPRLIVTVLNQTEAIARNNSRSNLIVTSLFFEVEQLLQTLVLGDGFLCLSKL